MVYRIFVEKKQGLANEATALLNEFKNFLGINSLKEVRLINRYDVEGISEELFNTAVKYVLSEPQLDSVSNNISTDGYYSFATEYLPGQFDQRADSAAQCIQLISHGNKPLVKTAKIYLISGELDDSDIQKIKRHVINPVESREASMECVETLNEDCSIPTTVKTLHGFCNMSDKDLTTMLATLGLAMDNDDLRLCRDYFASEHRDPTITEIRMIDTYWSDHCRHTTFLTTIDNVSFEDELLQKSFERYINTRKQLQRTKPINLMDLATIAMRLLKSEGKLERLDESDEINACTVKIDVNTDTGPEKMLLLFKNETHNHPTEIEPFGGAATCIGGAIRDPLSGRSYVYAAMRVTGAADPLKPINETLNGKLPQKKIVTTAANGYSSYGNQIGLATGIVDEIYHEGYAAKRMEIGAVIAATPESNVRREAPQAGDLVILLGGKTGRDGCGGATGSSKSHNSLSLENCGAEVQKGNAPEERKLQRLFRNPKASLLIKRCNDFGAGGVSVAIGELADGLCIDLNSVPKKYKGLDGTEIAISESQERMAVVVDKDDAEKFIRLANEENLEATVVAVVTKEPRLVMRWNDQIIVDVSREFLNSNGAEKHIDIKLSSPQKYDKCIPSDFESGMLKIADDLNSCSRKGLSERFDSTIGAGTVLMPFGGKYQMTPIQAMAHLIPFETRHTDTCSIMSWGYNPYISEKSPYHGAYFAVVESVCKLIATGAKFRDIYLTFQEYFEKPLQNPKRWGKPFSALLGAFDAQLDLGIASIGGKDSMSGSFEHIDVPPTLVSFAVTTSNASNIISPEFKKAGNKVMLISPEYSENGLPNPKSLISVFDKVNALIESGIAVSCYTPTFGGIAEAVMKASLGNRVGFKFNENISFKEIFGYSYASFILEVTEDISDGILLGVTTEDELICSGEKSISISKLQALYENKLEAVYPCNIDQKKKTLPKADTLTRISNAPLVKSAKPTVLIPVFPGTNCEYDSAKAFSDAGAEPVICVINNLSSQGIERSVNHFAESIKKSQIIFIPGGFSGGDEPDGSGKFITAFLRNERITSEINYFLKNRDGLMAGICNGFQALIKLGLIQYGEIAEPDESSPTLTFNTIARHQSMIVHTRVTSTMSPWLRNMNVGDIVSVPISHGEGRFFANHDVVTELLKRGQIVTQYVDLNGDPTSDIRYNPNNSVFAIEGVSSPDGRVFGKMGHSERIGNMLYKNVLGNYDIKMFKSAVEYFK